MTEVTKEDREAAASAAIGGQTKHLGDILSGKYDESKAVQAFARQREASTEALRAENARLREALKPFADLAGEAEESASDLQNGRPDFIVKQVGGYAIGDLDVADFIRARAALQESADD